METGVRALWGCSSSASDLLSLPSLHQRTRGGTDYRRPKPQWPLLIAASVEKVEIRVCVNRTCNRMGSREILTTLSDISPPGVTVKSCGRLGRCGAGPNVVVLPAGAIIGHCGTAARAADLLAEICSDKRGDSKEDFDPRKNLEAQALRKKAEVELQERGNPRGAEELLSQAIDLNPSGGLHLTYKTRSVARLTLGDHVGALKDANEALKIDGRFHLAYVCQGDAFMGMGEWAKAENAYLEALEIDPSIRRSKWFKDRVTKLHEKMATVYGDKLL